MLSWYFTSLFVLHLRWSDDSNVDFKFWDEGQPDDFAGEETCVGLHTAFGIFVDLGLIENSLTRLKKSV